LPQYWQCTLSIMVTLGFVTERGFIAPPPSHLRAAKSSFRGTHGERQCASQDGKMEWDGPDAPGCATGSAHKGWLVSVRVDRRLLKVKEVAWAGLTHESPGCSGDSRWDVALLDKAALRRFMLANQHACAVGVRLLTLCGHYFIRKAVCPLPYPAIFQRYSESLLAAYGLSIDSRRCSNAL
jgi:hypothetical protein